MKTSRMFVGAVVLGLASLFSPFASHAAEMPEAPVASQPPLPANCQATVKMSMTLTAHFVTLPDAPAFKAKGQGELCYEIDGKTAKIKGESIPRLTYESEKPPAGLSALTVLIDEMPGTTPVVSWKDFPEVQLEGADVRIRAYEARAAEITDDRTPIVDIVVPDVVLSTAPVAVEGIDSQGYVDGDALEAKLVGRTVLPEDDFPEYQKWLSGQEVLLELEVEVENPYDKKPADKNEQGKQPPTEGRQPANEGPKPAAPSHAVLQQAKEQFSLKPVCDERNMSCVYPKHGIGIIRAPGEVYK
ncbi:MAG: hypothetical protein WC956_04245 [bacterium]